MTAKYSNIKQGLTGRMKDAGVSMSTSEWLSLKKRFQALIPLDGLTPLHLEEIIRKSPVEEIPIGRYIFREGDKDDKHIYLLTGEIELLESTKSLFSINARDDQARHPLAHAQPRQLSGKTKTKSEIIRIDTALLDMLLTWDLSSSYLVEDIEGNEDVDWMTRMLQSDLFMRIPAANIQKILMTMQEIQVKAGQLIINQGEDGDYYYIIKQGKCAVLRKASRASETIKIAELSNGDSFGEDALISGSKRNASIEMLSDGILMRLDKDSFTELLEEPSIKWVNVEEANILREQGAQWIDVRMPNEYSQNHLVESVNIPLINLRDNYQNLDLQKKYILYCDAGARSAAGVFMLSQKGFDVCALQDGILSLPKELFVKSEEVIDEDKSNDNVVSLHQGFDADMSALSSAEAEKENNRLLVRIKRLEEIEVLYEQLQKEFKDQQLAAQENEKTHVGSESLKLNKIKEIEESLAKEQKNAADYKLQLEKRKDQLNKLVKEKDQLTAAFEKQQQKLQDNLLGEKDKNKLFKQQVAQQASELEDLSETISDLEVEKNTLDERYREIESKLSNAEASWQQELENKETALQEVSLNNDNYVQAIAESEKKITSLTESMQTLSDERDGLAAEIKNMQTNNAAQIDKVEVLREQEQQELQNAKEQIAQLVEKNQTAIDESQKEIALLVEAKDTLLQERNELTEEINKIEKNNIVESSKLEALRAQEQEELQHAKEQTAQLVENKQAAIAESQKEIALLVEAKDALLVQRDGLAAEIKKIQKNGLIESDKLAEERLQEQQDLLVAKEQIAKLIEEKQQLSDNIEQHKEAAEQQLEQQQVEVNQLQLQIKEVDNLKSNLLHEKENELEKNLALHAALEDKVTELSQALEKQKQQYQEELIQEQKRSEQLRLDYSGNKEDVEKRREQYDAELVQHQEEKQQLVDELAQHQQEKQQLVEELAQHQQRCQQLNDELEQHGQDKQQLTNELTQYEQGTQQLVNELRQSEQKLLQAQQDKAEQQKKLAELDIQVTGSSEQEEQWKEKINQLNEELKESAQWQIKFEHLQQQHKIEQKDKEEVLVNLGATSKENEKQLEQFSSLQAQYSQLESNMQEESAKNNEFQSEISKLQEKLTLADNQVQEMQTKIEHSMSNDTEQQLEQTALLEKLTELEGQLAAHAKEKELIKNIEAEKQILEDEINEIQQREMRALENEQKAKKEQEHQQDKNNQLSQEIELLHESNLRMREDEESLNVELKKFQEKVVELEAQSDTSNQQQASTPDPDELSNIQQLWQQQLEQNKQLTSALEEADARADNEASARMDVEQMRRTLEEKLDAINNSDDDVLKLKQAEEHASSLLIQAQSEKREIERELVTLRASVDAAERKAKHEAQLRIDAEQAKIQAESHSRDVSMSMGFDDDAIGSPKKNISAKDQRDIELASEISSRMVGALHSADKKSSSLGMTMALAVLIILLIVSNGFSWWLYATGSNINDFITSLGDMKSITGFKGTSDNNQQAKKSVTNEDKDAVKAPEAIVEKKVDKVTIRKGRVFRDSLPVGGDAPKMMPISAGSFMMGAASTSADFTARPQHEVKVKAFAISKNEITFTEYMGFARATGRPMPDDKGWGLADRPVINVSWDDAKAYTAWLSDNTGKRYRLPTEAEWEYMARAGSTRTFWWGPSVGANNANCFDCGSDYDRRSTAPVGRFKENAFGVNDVLGNVLEWVEDCYNNNYNGAPNNASAWQGGDCSKRIARGGAYDTPSKSAVLYKRFSYAKESRLDNIGFRVVRE